MSNYRDDVHEIGVGSDSTWGGLRFIVEEMGRGRDVLLFGLALLVVEVGYGADSIHDQALSVLMERGRGADQVIDAAFARSLVVERGRGFDAVIHTAGAVLVEQGRGFDDLLGGGADLVLETGRGADTIIGQRASFQAVAEQARGFDTLLGLHSTLVLDYCRGFDTILGGARASVLVLEAGRGADEVLDAVAARPAVVIERGRGLDEVFGTLHAADLVIDQPAVAWDELVYRGALVGQAWTAHADGWAMSRYDPFGFTGLAVIDGTVYATGPDGVYALDGESEQIAARLQTGRVDMTGGSLAHLSESHIEYELAGAAWMDVTLTQPGGEAKTFAYPLTARPSAAVLTNARFQFGRGLAGRHFAYTLRLTGQRAYINDWKVLAVPSKRSI